jgi:hypothetical protein
MVTHIESGKDIRKALYYNEKKVATGNAVCIMASGFLQAPADLNFQSKLQRFRDLNKKNLRSKTNTMHITINFHKSESYPVDVLSSIASSYMEKIGFGDQPFLVYEHFDAAHPHLHIVTTLIKQDGKRIPINNIGKNESEKARKEIEEDFQLVKAQQQGKRTEAASLSPLSISKALYGSSETKKSINDIVHYVTHTYRYTSVTELNALLTKYNVLADRGKEGSVMFNRKGLVYSIINGKGQRIGVPIKASELPFKPTLLWLEKRFVENEKLRIPFRSALSKKVLEAMNSKPISLAALQNALLKVDVELVYYTAKDGRIANITFIDHTSRTIFNESDLSKQLSAENIIATLAANKDNHSHEKTASRIPLVPWAWKRISTPVKTRSITNKNATSSRKSASYSSRAFSKDPSPFPLQVDNATDQTHYVSTAEYLWTVITMTYGAGEHTPADPLGINRKKKRRKKKRSF